MFARVATFLLALGFVGWFGAAACHAAPKSAVSVDLAKLKEPDRLRELAAKANARPPMRVQVLVRPIGCVRF